LALQLWEFQKYGSQITNTAKEIITSIIEDFLPIISRNQCGATTIFYTLLQIKSSLTLKYQLSYLLYKLGSPLAHHPRQSKHNRKPMGALHEGKTGREMNVTLLIVGVQR
jgi:hypothetical protein